MLEFDSLNQLFNLLDLSPFRINHAAHINHGELYAEITETIFNAPRSKEDHLYHVLQQCYNFHAPKFQIQRAMPGIDGGRRREQVKVQVAIVVDMATSHCAH
jgi:Mlc titration factor MtfA (ptsG expression regulator)